MTEDLPLLRFASSPLLTDAEFRTLARIWSISWSQASPLVSASLRQLAAALGLDRATLTRHLGALGRAGAVAVRRNERGMIIVPLAPRPPEPEQPALWPDLFPLGAAAAPAPAVAPGDQYPPHIMFTREPPQAAGAASPGATPAAPAPAVAPGDQYPPHIMFTREPLRIDSSSPHHISIRARGVARANREDEECKKRATATGLLLAAGVGRNTAERIAALPEASPSWVKRHLARAEAQGEPLRFAIHRMLNAERPGACPVCGAVLVERRQHAWVIDEADGGRVTSCPLEALSDSDLLPDEEIAAVAPPGRYQPLAWPERRPQ